MNLTTTNPHTLLRHAEAVDLRDRLLAEAKKITEVTDAMDLAAAQAVLSELKAFASEIEARRKEVKAPYIKLGKDIDALAESLAGSVVAVKDRIEKIAGSYVAEQRRKADEARKAAEAEAIRIKAEADRKAAAALEIAPTQAAGLRIADDLVGAAARESESLFAAAKAIAPKTAAGSRLRSTIKFEVSDIKALFAEFPELVSLVPNDAAIRDIIKTNPNIILPGLRHWVEEKFS